MIQSIEKESTSLRFLFLGIVNMIHKFQLEKYEFSSKRILEAWVDNEYIA